MALQNVYSNLPGHLVEFKDGGLQLTTSTTDTSATKSLLILGTAFDGPVNEPVKIDEITVSKVFGDEVDENGYPNGATLTKYAKQAFKNGFDDVRCMRVTGSPAYATISNSVVDDAADETNSTWVPVSAFAGPNGNVPEGQGKIRANEVALKFSYSGDGLFPGDSSDLVFTVGGEERQAEVSGNSSFVFKPYSGLEISRNSIYATQDIDLTIGAWHLLIGDSADPADATTPAGAKVVYADQDATDGVIELAPVTFNGYTASFYKGIYDGVVIPNSNNGIAKVTCSFTVGADEEAETVSGDVEFTVSGDVNRTITVTTTQINSIDIPADAKYTVETVQYYKVVENVTLYMDQIESDSRISYEGEGVAFPESYIDIPATIERGSDITITSVELYPENQGGKKVELPAGTYYTTSTETVGNKEVIRVKIINFNFNAIPNNFENLTMADVLAGSFHVNYKYKSHEYYELELKVKSQWGGEKYKTATVEVLKQTETVTDDEGNITESGPYTVIRLTKPVAKQYNQASNVIEYSSKYVRTVDDLILAMKNDANNLNMFDIEIVKGEGTDSIDMIDAMPATPLSNGGEDGVNVTPDELFIALSGDRYTVADVGNTLIGNTGLYVTSDMVGYLKTPGAYQILENYNVDYIYPAGVYADMKQNVNSQSDFQRELALLCAVLTYRTKMTHGFIDVKPNSNTTLVGIDNYVANLVNSRSNIYYMLDENGDVLLDDNGKPSIDIGWYTSVVVGPEPVMQSDKLGTYYGSPAIAYAALNAVIDPASAPTNKAIRNVQGMKFKFSNKQADALVGARYVVFKLKNEGKTTAASSTPYVVDGCTAGAPNCDYSRIVTVKVLQDVVDQIREVADPFIGEQNTTAQRNALSALISKRLGKLVELGEILSYEFEISATIQQQLLGEATIALTIVPAMELRKITTVVALRAAE